ncbi:MAG: hypothetical protein PVJ86_13960 [Phycisphaerales bacterium]|jgi:hypothetical protein
MTKRELAAFILKLLGIYALIRSLPLLQYLGTLLGLRAYESEEILRRAWMYVSLSIPFALTAVAGVVLLACSRGLAAVVVKQDGNAKLSTSLRGEDVQAIGFSVVAVFVFLSAMPQLARFITSLSYIAYVGLRDVPERGMWRFTSEAWQSGLSVAVQCALAGVLFFRARGLANLWRRIQVGKYVRIEDAEQSAPCGSQEPPSAGPSTKAG